MTDSIYSREDYCWEYSNMLANVIGIYSNTNDASIVRYILTLCSHTSIACESMKNVINVFRVLSSEYKDDISLFIPDASWYTDTKGKYTGKLMLCNRKTINIGTPYLFMNKQYIHKDKNTMNTVVSVLHHLDFQMYATIVNAVKPLKLRSLKLTYRWIYGYGYQDIPS